MADEHTCGKGLAQHSALPAKFSAVAKAMGEVLEHHRTSLDTAHASSKAEYEAYTVLANAFYGHASLLDATAGRMAGYRDLPMTPHDQAALTSAKAVKKLEQLVRAERELIELLRGSTEMYEKMLGQV